MANPFHNTQVAPSRKGGKTPRERKPGPAGSLNIEMGFATGKLPGKTQGKDRSGGVEKIQQYPASEGL